MLDAARGIKVRLEGGAVERAHVLPHSGSYSVAMHSYNMLCILFQLNPTPSLRLVQAVLEHDVPERWLGDIPGTAKIFSRTLGAAFKEAETSLCEQLGLIHCQDLCKSDLKWLAYVDLLEFWIWARDQLRCGNLHMEGAQEKVTQLLLELEDRGELPSSFSEFSGVWRRDIPFRLGETPDDIFGEVRNMYPEGEM